MMKLFSTKQWAVLTSYGLIVSVAANPVKQITFLKKRSEYFDPENIEAGCRSSSGNVQQEVSHSISTRRRITNNIYVHIFT